MQIGGEWDTPTVFNNVAEPFEHLGRDNDYLFVHCNSTACFACITSGPSVVNRPAFGLGHVPDQSANSSHAFAQRIPCRTVRMRPRALPLQQCVRDSGSTRLVSLTSTNPSTPVGYPARSSRTPFTEIMTVVILCVILSSSVWSFHNNWEHSLREPFFGKSSRRIGFRIGSGGLSRISEGCTGLYVVAVLWAYSFYDLPQSLSE